MITIGIPVFNEEKYIENTCEKVIKAAQLAGNIPIEIIIVNDGSTDRTHEILKKLSNKYRFIRIITHEKNLGIGVSIKDVLKEAEYNKLSFIPGDDFLTLFTLKNIFLNADKADVIMYYYINTEERYKYRIVLSSFFTLIYMVVFDIHLKYINGIGIYPTKLLRSLPIKSKGYNITAEMTLKLLLSGCSYYEVIGYLKPNSISSTALKIKNIINVFWSFIRLYFDVKYINKKLYNKKPRRVIDQEENYS
ncbi:MAG: glycosyltransferase family 2 protein [Flavobacteriales bacterium]|nr:glycosyltransferase family 2 protein [Leptospiraceae bacterium]MCB9336319.1 glycosyltransferase family 2 protein [Flavobacteriales bacterium]